MGSGGDGLSVYRPPSGAASVTVDEARLVHWPNGMCSCSRCDEGRADSMICGNIQTEKEKEAKKKKKERERENG